MSHEHHHEHSCLHLGFEIAKLALKAASVAAAFCMVHEIHKVHTSIKKR